jgi:hypothetical protein
MEILQSYAAPSDVVSIRAPSIGINLALKTVSSHIAKGIQKSVRNTPSGYRFDGSGSSRPGTADELAVIRPSCPCID